MEFPYKLDPIDLFWDKLALQNVGHIIQDIAKFGIGVF